MKKEKANLMINFKDYVKPRVKNLFRKKIFLSLEKLKGESDCLIAGPFLGEFGWELMQWQGYIRQLSKFYKHVIVYGRPSSAFLYKDFVSEFIEMNISSWDTDAYLLRDFNYSEWAAQFKEQDILIADNSCKELSLSLIHI